MLKHCHATANERGSTRSSRRLLNTTNTSNISLSSSSGESSSLLSKFDSRRSSYSSPESFSRASSILSLNTNHNPSEPTTPIRVFAKCLRPDIEYKTLGISLSTTSSEVVKLLLSKFKMKHRDPKLFYLSMDIHIGGSEPRRTLILEDDARPAELKSCHPWGHDCRFILMSRKGALVRIWDSVLNRDSKYKSLLISEKTNVGEIIKILFRCTGNSNISSESLQDYCLVERCESTSYERPLHPQDCPALIQSLWPNPSSLRFVLLKATPSHKDPTIMEVQEEEEEEESMELSTCSSSSSPVTPKYCRPYHIKRAAILKPPRSLSTSTGGGSGPPPLAPKPFRSSFGSSSSVGSQTSFHDYENYFYI